MSDIDWVVFDVDDVMLDMDTLAHEAEAAIETAMRAHFDADTASQIRKRVCEGYATLRGQLRAGADEDHHGHADFYARVVAWQRGVTEAGHEVKRWSRQVLVALALEDLGLPVTDELVQAGARAYWEALGAGTILLPDAARAVRRNREAGRIVHLATNSDGWLSFDEARGTFVYDPAEAEREKRRRLEPILQEGLRPEDLTIGDPVGKPAAGFYTAVLADIEAKTGRPVDVTRLLPVGDSLTNDVLPFMALGAPRGVWILRRPADDPEPHPGVLRVASLDDMTAAEGGA